MCGFGESTTCRFAGYFETTEVHSSHLDWAVLSLNRGTDERQTGTSIGLRLADDIYWVGDATKRSKSARAFIGG